MRLDICVHTHTHTHIHLKVKRECLSISLNLLFFVLFYLYFNNNLIGEDSDSYSNLARLDSIGSFHDLSLHTEKQNSH